MSNAILPKSSRVLPAVVTAIIAGGVVYVVSGGGPMDINRATTPGAIGPLLLIASASIVCAVVAHLAIPRWFLASTVSGLAFTTLAQVIGYVSLGYLDPFFIVALVVGALIGFAIATIVGIPFLFFRRHRTLK